MYDTSSIAALHLGYPDEGHLSTYYPDSPGITKKEIELVSDFLKDQGLMPENTRLRKTTAGDFELLIASATKEPEVRDTKNLEWTLDGELSGKKVKLIYGDHFLEMVSTYHLRLFPRKFDLTKPMCRLLAAHDHWYQWGDYLINIRFDT